MVRSELITRLAERFPALVRQDVEVSVSEILGAISGALVRADRVEIRGFGVFHLNPRPPRIGRNPKTGELVQVPAKYTPHFKPGKGMRAAVGKALASNE